MVKLNSVLQNKLRTQSLEGLAKTFMEFNLIGIAKEVKAGKNVVQNIEYGLYIIHDWFGPTVNPLTGAFYPQTIKDLEKEKKLINLIDTVLVDGGYHKISQNLLPKLRRKDIAYEKRMRKRFETRFHKVIE